MAARAPPVPAAKAPPAPPPVHTVSHHGRQRLQPRLRVTQPGDPAEREADRIAHAIAREVAAPAPRLRTGAVIHRKASGAAAPPPATAERLRAAARGGTALTPAQRAFFEPRLKVDLAAVRLHTGQEAGRLAASLGARAFAHGRHIFFAAGEYRPETPDGIELLAHELVHTVQQGAAPEARVQRKPGQPVTERLPADSVAGWGLSDLLSALSDLAHAIPGYRMLTIVLGADPITGRGVSRSAANILRALVEFLPGGVVITRVLDAHGVFDRIAALASAALDSVGLSSAGLKALLDQFLETVSWRDVFDPAGIWRRASRIFSGPVDRLIAAGRALAGQILAIVREAVLKPLAALAEGTEGYALLKAVLGFDPVTGTAVPRTAETLIAPFLRLVGQEELWQNLQRANAIPRAFAWFEGAMAGVVALVRSIPSRFMAALGELQIADFLVLPRAFLRLAGAFAGFMGEFARFAGSTILDLLKIIAEVVAPGVMPYLQRAGGAFETILRNPVGFVSNLVRAGRMGFEQFAGRFLTHLRASLVAWLTGTLGGTGIHIPQAFTPQEILKFVLSVLGLTWAQVRTRLVRILGEAPVRALETGFALVRTLVTQGPAAAWQEIVAAAGNLRDMVIEQVMAFVKSRVVEAAVTRLVSMLSPAGALIQAIIAIYNTVMFFVERLRQIARVAAAFIDSIAAIAAGALGAAANRVEQTMAGLLTLVISFLARLAGIGRVADAVTGLIQRVRAPIERGIDRAVQWIVAQARRAGRFIAQAGVPQDPATRLRQGLDLAERAVNALSGTSVTEAMIRPVLSGIRVRYGFQSLVPRVREGVWWVEGTVNPSAGRRTRKTAAERRAERAGEVVASLKVGDLVIMSSGGRFVNRDPLSVERITDTHIFARAGSTALQAAKSSYNVVWRKFAEAGSLWTLDRILAANGTDSWGDFDTARRVLNYRYHEFQLNPGGKQWEHVVERSFGRATGAAVNSVTNLALTDGSFNRWLGTVFGRSYTAGELRGFPSTQGQPLRTFLLTQPQEEHVRWKEALYRNAGKSLQLVSGPRGRYQILA